MSFRPEQPLIVQSDRSLLLEVGGPHAEACRDALAPFCELLKSPEHVHTYRITPISVWNAASAGMAADDMVGRPRAIQPLRPAQERRAGRARPARPLRPAADGRGPRRAGTAAVGRGPAPADGGRDEPADEGVRPPDGRRARSASSRSIGARSSRRSSGSAGRSRTAPATSTAARSRSRCASDPAERAPLRPARLPARLGRGVLARRRRARRQRRRRAALRRGQDGRRAWARWRRSGARPSMLTTNLTAVEQWRRELLDEDRASRGRHRRVHGRLEGDPLRHDRDLPDPHPSQVEDRRVHALRALPRQRLGPHHLRRGPPAARAGLPPDGVDPGDAAARADGDAPARGRSRGRRLQPDRPQAPRRARGRSSRRRAGSPRRSARRSACALPKAVRERYVGADRRDKFRLAAENPRKLDVLVRSVRAPRGRAHPRDRPVPRRSSAARRAASPRRSSRARRPGEERRRLYEAFRAGAIPVLVVSKVGNFAVDLPDATVLVQISGTFGSRQEEAQRLGRVLRPKEDGRQRALLHARLARDDGGGLRAAPPALPDRAGLRVRDRRRLRRRGGRRGRDAGAVGLEARAAPGEGGLVSEAAVARRERGGIRLAEHLDAVQAPRTPGGLRVLVRRRAARAAQARDRAPAVRRDVRRGRRLPPRAHAHAQGARRAAAAAAASRLPERPAGPVPPRAGRGRARRPRVPRGRGGAEGARAPRFRRRVGRARALDDRPIGLRRPGRARRHPLGPLPRRDAHGAQRLLARGLLRVARRPSIGRRSRRASPACRARRPTATSMRSSARAARRRGSSPSSRSSCANSCCEPSTATAESCCVRSTPAREGATSFPWDRKVVGARARERRRRHGRAARAR